MMKVCSDILTPSSYSKEILNHCIIKTIAFSGFALYNLQFLFKSVKSVIHKLIFFVFNFLDHFINLKVLRCQLVSLVHVLASKKYRYSEDRYVQHLQ